MATPLFIKALELNEKVSLYCNVASPPFRWNPIQHEYWHDSSCVKKLLFYLFYFLVILGLWPLATFTILLKGLMVEDSVDPAHLVITFMQGVFWSFAVGFFTFFHIYSEIIADVLNKVFRYFWRHAVDPDLFNKSEKTYEHLIRKELRNLLRGGQDVDLLGICANLFVVILVIVPPGLTLTVMFTRIDPFSLAIFYAFPEQGNDLMASWSVALFTNGVSVIVALEACNVIRLVLLPLLTVVHQYRNFIHYVKLLGTKDIFKAVKIYADFYVLHLRVRQIAGPCILMVMAVGFVNQIIANALTVSGYHILPIYIYWFEPTVVVGGLIGIMGTLPYASYVYDFCENMIIRWKEQVSLKGKAVILGRRLKTFRPLCFYCGNIGVLKKESKTLYLAGIFNYTVNLIIFIKHLKT